MDELRSEARHETYMPGRAAFAGRVYDCTVRDISASGARLSFADANSLPDEFELLVLTTGELFRVGMKWRRGRQIGVYFIEKDQIVSID
jgi:hypothetical protein